jgi:hypothetical protein
MAMEVPFSHEAFLNVFGSYNTTLWPVAAALWLATAWLAWVWIRRGHLDGRLLFGLLAVHWAWSGVVYHWIYFRPINPAATLFAAGFVTQAVLFGWLAATSRGHVLGGTSVRRILGGVVLSYGLVYPLLGFVFGLQYPRLPLFAVPCPTTLVTAGWLIGVTGVPRVVSVVPILWAVVGSSAAVALGVQADLGLVVAGALLALNTLVPSALGAERAVRG